MGSVDFPNRRFDASRRVELNGMIDALSKSNCPIKIAASAYKIKFGDSAMPEYILHKTQWNSKGASKSIEELSVRKKTFSQQDILLRCLRMFAQYSKRKDAGSSSNKNQSRCCSVAGFVSYHDVTLILQRVQKDLGINLLAGSNIRKLFERKGWSNRRYLSYNEFLETCSCLLDITHEQVKREKNLTKLSTNQLLIKNQTISKNVEHEEAGHCNFGLPARRNGVASTNLNKKEGKDETTLFHQVPCGMSLPFSMAQWKSKSASFFDYSLEGSMPPRPKTAPNRVSTHHSTWPRIEYVKSFEVELESGVGVLNAETSNAKKNSSPQKRKHQYHTKEKKIQITSYKTNKEGDKVCCNAHNSCKKGSKKSGFVEESFSGTINSLSKEIIDDCTKNEKTIYDDSMKETGAFQGSLLFSRHLLMNARRMTTAIVAFENLYIP
mmetsp:Transcript_22469/g.25907  ORF Transcript_22469/g.25907 Transcript_22469/m.25907 type:complete len:437 (+) Transcript_22469:145-1455(+)